MDSKYYNTQFRQEPPIPPAQYQNGTNHKKVVAPDIYISDDLFLNLGKQGEFYMSFPDSIIERDKMFSGIIYAATQDHIIVYNQSLKEWYMLPLMYLNYTIFKEKPIISDIFYKR